MKIVVGSTVTKNIRYMEYNTRERICRFMRKEAVRCVQNVVSKKKFLIQFLDVNKRDIITFLRM